MAVVGQRHGASLFTTGKDPVPVVQKAGWAAKTGLDGCGKSRPLPPKGIRSQDRPVRSESLYRPTNGRHVYEIKSGESMWCYL